MGYRNTTPSARFCKLYRISINDKTPLHFTLIPVNNEYLVYRSHIGYDYIVIHSPSHSIPFKYQTHFFCEIETQGIPLSLSFVHSFLTEILFQWSVRTLLLWVIVSYENTLVFDLSNSLYSDYRKAFIASFVIFRIVLWLENTIKPSYFNIRASILSATDFAILPRIGQIGIL